MDWASAIRSFARWAVSVYRKRFRPGYQHLPPRQQRPHLAAAAAAVAAVAPSVPPNFSTPYWWTTPENQPTKLNYPSRSFQLSLISLPRFSQFSLPSPFKLNLVVDLCKKRKTKQEYNKREERRNGNDSRQFSSRVSRLGHWTWAREARSDLNYKRERDRFESVVDT